jgi:uroporphyrinogen decarboxylase
MNKWERLAAAYRRQPVDHLPIALWRHFPEEDQSATGLAKAVLAFQRQFDLDFVKMTSSSDYMPAAWGLRGEYQGSPEGVRAVLERPVKRLAEWEQIRPLDPAAGPLGVQLDAIRLLAKELAGEAPLLPTVFSPLSTLRKLRGDGWLDELRAHPDVVRPALDAVAETTTRFAQEALRAGADGIFYATQAASVLVMSEAEYREVGERYDRQILDAVAERRDWNVLHLHGEAVMFDLAGSYPVAAVNWHDRLTPPTLSEALARFPGGLIGGLDEATTMLTGTPDAVAGQVADAVAQTSGRGLLIGAGCVIRIDTPEENIRAAVAAAKGQR